MATRIASDRIRWFNRIIRLAVCLSILVLCLKTASAQTMRIGSNIGQPGWGTWDATRGHSFDPFVENYTQVSGKEPIWKPDFLEDLSILTGGLRFMTMNCINQTHEVDFHKTGRWADRKQKNDPSQYMPVAYEYYFDLSNKLDKDVYLNVPHTADEEYFRELAKLTHRDLKKSLNVIIEWSNETWNYGFNQSSYCEQKAGELGLGSGLTGRARYCVYQSVRLFKAFQEQFKDEPHRVITVLGGWTGHNWTADMLNAVKDSRINPDNIKVDAYSIAPYVGHSLSGGSTDIVEQLYNELNNSVVPATAQAAQQAKAAGMRFFAYEGNHHVTNNHEPLRDKPEMYDWYIDYYNKMSPYFEQFFFYSYAGGGPWGLKDHIAQPRDSSVPYNALRDWLKANPVATGNARHQGATMSSPLMNAPFTIRVFLPSGNSIPGQMGGTDRSSFHLLDLKGRFAGKSAPAVLLQKASDDNFWVLKD